MARSRLADQVGRVVGGRYRLLAAVGTGASADVYVADDVSLRRRVAVKVLHDALASDDGFLRRFRAEARAVASLRHPNIMAVFDWGEEGDGPFLVLEYLGGGSLRDLLDGGHRLSPSQATLVGLEAARGLDHAHRRGLVHRDIKPANLLFDDEGRLAIADFGIARALAEATWTEPSGAVVGTVRYASPEQARGNSMDGRADVYALALVLVEAVTGSVPFASDTTIATLMARLDRPIPAPEALGPLGAVIEASGAVDPADRVDAAGLVRALEAVATRLPRPAQLPLAPPHRLPVQAAEDDTRTAVTPIPGLPIHGPDPRTLVFPATASGPAAGPPAGPLSGPIAGDTSGPSAGDIRGPTAGGLSGPSAGGPGGRTAGPSAGPAADIPTAPFASATPPPTAPLAPFQANSGEATTKPRRSRWRYPWIAVGVIAAALAVALAVFALPGLMSPASYTVPALAGRPIVEVMSTKYPHFTVVRHDVREGPDLSTVIRQNPPAATRHHAGPITVDVSIGYPLAPVPDLKGETVTAAKAKLDAAGLALSPTQPQVFSDSIAAGHIVSWTPHDTSIPMHDVVTVTVSGGPEMVPMPDVTGKTVAQAIDAMNGVGITLAPVQTLAFNDKVKAGLVISSDPPAGASADRAKAVALIVSKGPDVVTVPDVTGQSVSAAEAALRAAGLVPRGPYGPPGANTVDLTLPQGGRKAKRGSTVDIYANYF